MGVELAVASPEGYGFASVEAARLGIGQTADPAEAAPGARFIYTAVWVSLGQDAETEARSTALADYQVNARLMPMPAASSYRTHEARAGVQQVGICSPGSSH